MKTRIIKLPFTIEYRRYRRERKPATYLERGSLFEERVDDSRYTAENLPAIRASAANAKGELRR